MKKGDWIFDGYDSFGIAKGDPYESIGRLHVDVVLYDRNGNRVGRLSPAMGGPKGFEPACSADEWRVIHRPDFPLPRWDDLRHVLKVLPHNAATDNTRDGGEE